jgi:hypothetical protein
MFAIMLRKLLTLFVLVTGLAAIGQPAQARAADLQSAGFASFSTSSPCAVQAGARVSQFSAGLEQGLISSRTCPKPPRVVVVVPTVMLQADRARE